eukprot:550481-Heterocapsa_arctica.AAC.1
MQDMSDTSPAELLIGGTLKLKHWVDIPMTPDQRSELQHHDAYLVVRCFASGQREVVIERELNVLTLTEAKANLDACQKAM